MPVGIVSYGGYVPHYRIEAGAIGADTPQGAQGDALEYSAVAGGSPFQMQIPYTMAIIELDEGTRFTSQIVDRCNGDVKIGSWVEAVFRKLGEEGKSGIIHYGYKFKIIE
ncbi:MAG: OB-fold domain-containing protein [Thermoplasmata archaeon]